jgi:glycosyltransferase involved in cell wall biosynthesis
MHYYMQFFPGEGSPGSLQPFSFACALASRGHDVTVVSADYNVDSGLTESVVDRSVGSGHLRVLRLPCPRGGRGGNRQRLRAYLSFMFSAIRASFKLERPDVVVGSIQPMSAGWAALRAVRHAAAPFVLEIRDLWPDALVVKGAITPLQARPLQWIVNTLYRESVRIVSLTPGIKTELLKKGIPPRKVDVFPNGFNPQLFSTCSPRPGPVRHGSSSARWLNGSLA